MRRAFLRECVLLLCIGRPFPSTRIPALGRPFPALPCLDRFGYAPPVGEGGHQICGSTGQSVDGVRIEKGDFARLLRSQNRSRDDLTEKLANNIPQLRCRQVLLNACTPGRKLWSLFERNQTKARPLCRHLRAGAGGVHFGGGEEEERRRTKPKTNLTKLMKICVQTVIFI